MISALRVTFLIDDGIDEYAVNKSITVRKPVALQDRHDSDSHKQRDRH